GFSGLQSSIVWLNARQIAGFYHWLDPIPQLVVNHSGYGQVLEDDGAMNDCVTLNVSSGVLSTSVCSNKHDFVCIEDKQLPRPGFRLPGEHVNVVLRPNRPPILHSSQLPDLTLTCRAGFTNGSVFMEATRGSYAYAYVWTKNGIYLNETFRSIQPEKVSERTAFAHSYASSQGHYRCGLKALPSGSTVWSGTVTVVLEGELQQPSFDFDTHPRRSLLAKHILCFPVFRPYSTIPNSTVENSSTSRSSLVSKTSKTSSTSMSSSLTSKSSKLSFGKFRTSLGFEFERFRNFRTALRLEFEKFAIFEHRRVSNSKCSEVSNTAEIRIGKVRIYCPSWNLDFIRGYTQHYVGAVPTIPMCLTKSLELVPRQCKVNFTSSAKLARFDFKQCHYYKAPTLEASEFSQCCIFENITMTSTSKERNSRLTWAQAAEVCNRWHGFLPVSSTTRPGEWSGLSLKYGYIQADSRGYPDVLDALKRSGLLVPEIVPGQSPSGKCFVIAPPPSAAARSGWLSGEGEPEPLADYPLTEDHVLYSTPCTGERPFSCTLKYERGIRSLSPCPRRGWLDWDSGNKCLWVNYTRTGFESAQEACASFGGQLATFKREVSYLTTIVLLLNEKGGLQKPDTYWMGLRRSTSGTYEWIDGEPLTTSNWHPRTDYTERAGQIRVNRYYPRHPLELRWSLGNAASRLPFICEIPLKTGNAWLRVQMTRAERRVTFRCNVSPEVLPGTIIWYKDGLGVKGNRLQTGTDDVVLTEISATRDSPYLQGYYWCEGLTVDRFRRVESRKQLLRFSDVKSLACSLQLAQPMIQPPSYRSLRSFTDFASVFRDDVLSIVQRTSHGYRPYEVQVTSIVEGTNLTAFVNFLVYLKMPLRVPRSLDLEEERAIISQLSTSLANPDRELRKIVVPGTAVVSSTEICFPEVTQHEVGLMDTLSWPTTAVGSLATSIETCIHEDMRPVVRRCEGNFTVGAFWGPVQGICMMTPTQRTLDLKALSQEQVNNENMGATADQLKHLSAESESLDPLDVVYVAATVENIASTGAISRMVAENVVAALDNVRNAEESTLQLSRSANSTNRILGAMEGVSLRLDSDTVVFRGSVALGRISKSQPSTLGVAIHLDLEQTYSFEDQCSLPYATYTLYAQGTDVAFVFSKSDQFQLDHELSIGIMGTSPLFEDSFQLVHDESELVPEICSSVLLANYEKQDVHNVREPFSIYFKQSCDITPVEVECVFWDPRENHDLGAWSTAGCEYIGLEREYHVCNCTHLTSFAVLFRRNDRSRRSRHDHVLSYLTFIGIALSALGLLMVIFTYICHKRWRKGVGHQILMHLSVSLLGALGAYVALVSVPRPRTGVASCACIGGLLHYLLLVSFCWTFVEALLQYLRFVKVLGTYVPNLVFKAALGAWGLPALIVVTVLAIDPGHYYQRARICWLGRDVLLYSFLAPVATILLANCVVFSVVIFSIYCRRHKGLRSNQSQVALAKAQLRATICIVFLLGLTWIFAYLSLLEEASRSWGRLFEYLFVASSSIQGFVIFLFHVAYEKTAREFWLGNLVYKVLPSARKRSFDHTGSKNTLSSTGQKTTST
ncbi:unnamed protein product, partial [Ixodes hexagonus]